LVPYNESVGWAWLSDQTLELRGDRCAELKTGDVSQVQVVTGCQTAIE
jgi:hypothetical protein